MSKKMRIGVLILALILAINIFPPNSLEAASSSEIRKQINQLKKEKEEIGNKIEEIQIQYDENFSEIETIIAKKNVIDQEIQIINEEIMNINEQITAYNVLIADAQDEVDVAKTEYEELQEQSRYRIRAMEENGKISYWDVIFKANSFSDLLSKVHMVRDIAEADQRMLKNLEEARLELEIAKKELEDGKTELTIVKQELDDKHAEMDEKKTEADNLLQELITKAGDLELLKEEFEKQEQDFLDEIAKKEEEFDEAKQREWEAYMATYVPPTTAPPKNQTSSSGNNIVVATGWIRPCNYILVSSPFGNRVSPTSGASTYHQGIDLAANTGTPVWAASSGVVAVAGWSSAAGNYVKITHPDGFSSIYMHLHTINTKAGAVVGQGQQIGTVGNTGVSTGPHLHFGIAKNGVYVNPANYISF